MGTKLYSTPPTGTRWEAGRLFWDVVPGRAVAFVHGFVWAYNGHRKGSTAMVDLIEENGRELRKVHVPSLTLSRDLALWQGRWVAVHILRDGQRRPWRAVPVSDGPWAARAAELNRAG
ncbi:hypothetical protein ACIA8H_12910 [Streptomyces goshikiensis]|uniref:hypothetical protein n=1 Tax=Streptomyces goshikiensis TaxID=1942 RepID=UPI003787F7D5